MMTNLGYNDSGDFDQLSLAGVDFGEDYTQKRNINPKNLEGEYVMQYAKADFGLIPQGLSGDYQQLGIVPEGLGADHQQMGLVPQGLGADYQQMGHSYQQLGVIPSGMGSQYQQLGAFDMNAPLFSLGGFSVTPMKLALGAGLLLAGHYMRWYKLPIPIPQM